MPDSFVVVCGATGNQGGAVVEALLRRGRFRVRALVRDPRKAAALAGRGVDLVTGDLGDTESLVRAFSPVREGVLQDPHRLRRTAALPSARSSPGRSGKRTS